MPIHSTRNIGTHWKVFLKNDDGSTIEIRRFDSHLHTPDFESICNKLKSIFPELRDKNFTVSWIDEEGDEIRITSSEELNIAQEISNETYSRNISSSLLKRPSIKLHVKLNQKDKNIRFFQKEAIIHDNIICDGCNNTISGYRYKCMTCDDFDLCSQCETLGLHPEHFMLRMLQPLDWSTNSGRSFLHYIKTFIRRQNLSYCNRESSCHERKNEKQPEGNAATNENIVEESPKRNIKLVDLTVDEPPPLSDNTFVSHNNTISAVLQPLMEEWTILDKTDISPASSVSSNLNESCESNLATAPVTITATAPVTTTGTTTATAPVTIPRTTTGTTSATAPVITPVTTSAAISAATSVITSATTLATATVTASEAAARIAALNNLTARNHSRIYPALPKESRIHHPNPRIHNALVTMISMGFSNNGGVLTHLLETENGDINRVIDILEYGKT